MSTECSRARRKMPLLKSIVRLLSLTLLIAVVALLLVGLQADQARRAPTGPRQTPIRTQPAQRIALVISTQEAGLPVPSASRTATPTPSNTRTPRPPTRTPSSTPTRPPSDTPSPTPTPTDSATPTASRTATPSLTATVTPIPPSPTATPRPQSHVVQVGETLNRIAATYGLTLADLARANNLFDYDRILVGQVLIIPPIVTPAIVPQIVFVPSNTPSATATLRATPSPAHSASLPALAFVPTLPPTAGAALWIAAPERVTPVPSLATPGAITVNGIPMAEFLVMPEAVKANVRAIFEAGQAQGRNPQAFSRLGDSTIENPQFLSRFDTGPYNLGPYAYLQGTIDHFRGSFGRQGVGVKRGLHTWNVFDPMWADPATCAPGENMLDCELRVHNPAVLIVKLGSNDVGVPETTIKNLRLIVEYCIEHGIVPILGTKADRHEGPGNVNNNIVRQVAAEYRVPLWDFDLLAGTLPGRGIAADGVHLTTFYAHDWSQPGAYQSGYGVNNLTALMALDQVWRSAQGIQ